MMFFYATNLRDSRSFVATFFHAGHHLVGISFALAK